MPGSNMDGIRDIRFVVSGVGTFEVENTDFFVDYDAVRRSDGQVELALSLNQVWEHSDFTDDQGIDRRVYVEAAIKNLKWIYGGQKGTLTLDFNTPAISRSYSDITLMDVSSDQVMNNNGFEYSMNFSYPIDGFDGSAEIARTFEFGAHGIENTDNLIVRTSRADRTAFKSVFRAAAVRVPGGPGLKTVELLGIRMATTGASALIKRQNAESIIDTYAGYVGESGDLKVDGVSRGTHHLRSIRPSRLDLPDAVTFELQFLTEYST